MSHSTPAPVHVPHHETHYDSHVSSPTSTLRYQTPLPSAETRFREVYTWDKVGNLLERNSQYANGNLATDRFTYDALGRYLYAGVTLDF